jgi:antitoxin component YwqK of YwqJK toxin-antitoxin module
MSDITPEILEQIRQQQAQRKETPVSPIIEKTPETKPQNILEGFDDLGNLIYQISFDQDVKQGPSTFYQNGRKISETTFENDILNGPFKTYHPNGAISVAGTYSNGVMDNALLAYSAEKVLIKKETYQMGVKEGLSQIFYPSGELYEETIFSNDQPTGESKTYYKNQSLMMLKRYKDGMLICQETYNDSGELVEKQAMTPKEQEDA